MVEAIYTFEKFEQTKPELNHEKFDRHAKEPPVFLSRLRNKGRIRTWETVCRTSMMSTAVGQMDLSKLKTERGVFLDAGCGYSPDACIATRGYKFQSAIKIDLFPIDDMDSKYLDSFYKVGGKHSESLSVKLSKLEANKVKFIQADICDMSEVEDKTVDVISSNAVLDLMSAQDRQLFYNECERVMRPGGLLTVSYVPLVNGYDDWFGWDELWHLKSLGFEQLTKAWKSGFVVRKST